jgi:hypothetical protein
MTKDEHITHATRVPAASRRTMLMGLAAAASISAPAVATALASATGTDPVFDAIRREQAAAAACRKAQAAFTCVEDEIPDDDLILHEEAGYLEVGFYKGKPLQCRTLHDLEMAFGMMGVERKVPFDRSSPLLHALQDEYQAALVRFDDMIARTERGKAWRAEHRYDELDAAVSAAQDAWWNLQEELLQTRPTSITGLLAFLSHLSKADKDEWMDEWAALAFPTILASIRSLLPGAAARA